MELSSQEITKTEVYNENIVHLTSADYTKIPQELLLLSFIPESKADLIEDSGIVKVLAEIFGTILN